MNATCCASPRLVRAYVPFKPFGKSTFCLSCGEVASDMHPVVEWLWSHLLSPFWFGQVTVYDKQAVE